MSQYKLNVKKIEAFFGSAAFFDTGYSFVKAADWVVHQSVSRYWSGFADSWNHLDKDNYMQNGATFRERRFGHFIYHEENGRIQPTGRTSFYQSKNINNYAGGVDRIFTPLKNIVYYNRFLHHIIESSLEQFRLTFGIKSKMWDVTLHQFRILASNHTGSKPTPEGIHRDGHKFVSMHLIRRENIEGGISKLYNNNLELIKERTLVEPMDSLLIADEILMHDVTSIRPVDPTRPAYRDMLIIDYNLKTEED
jgi:hypothetical protein